MVTCSVRTRRLIYFMYLFRQLYRLFVIFVISFIPLCFIMEYVHVHIIICWVFFPAEFQIKIYIWDQIFIQFVFRMCFVIDTAVVGQSILSVIRILGIDNNRVAFYLIKRHSLLNFHLNLNPSYLTSNKFSPGCLPFCNQPPVDQSRYQNLFNSSR